MPRYSLLPTAGSIALALALALTACGGQTMSGGTKTITKTVTVQASGTTTAPPVAVTTASTTVADTSAASTAASDLTGPVGTSFTDTDSNGNVMAVKLVQIIDPAQGANEFDTPNNGFRFVGAKFKIRGKSGTFSDDANSDTVLIGSDHQTYSPDFDDIAGCTNFNAGSYTVTPGRSTLGCVVFQVPDGVKVGSIQWGGQFGGTPATWTR